jgi:hypothetical protein
MTVVGRWMDRWGGSGGKRTEVEAETVHRKGGETCDFLVVDHCDNVFDFGSRLTLLLDGVMGSVRAPPPDPPHPSLPLSPASRRPSSRVTPFLT